MKNKKIFTILFFVLMLLQIITMPVMVAKADNIMPDKVDNVSIKLLNKTVEVGDEIQIEVDFESENNFLLDNFWQHREDEFLNWEISNENVIEMTEIESLHRTFFKAVGIGTSTITLSMGGKSDSITITVKGHDGTVNDVGRIVLDMYGSLQDLTETQSFYIGQYVTLDASLYYADDSGDRISDENYYDLIKWKSSNDNILKFIGNKEEGNFIVNGFGTVTITGVIGNNSDSITITLVPEGELITSEEHLYKYINECLKSGIYNMKFSKRSPYKITMYEIYAAVELSSEYLYQDIINEKYDDNGKLLNYDWAPFHFKENSESSIVGFDIEGSDNYKSLISKTDKKADQIINKIITDKMTDEQKLETIFRYLVLNCKLYKFIEEENRGEIIDNLNYTPYNVLVLKKGNMAGVSRAFNLLVRKAGIQSMKIGDFNRLGFVGDRCYNVVRVNNELKYFSFLNMSSDFVTEKEQTPYIKERLEDGFMLSSIKGYTNDDVKYNKKFLNYVVVEKNELLLNIKVSPDLFIAKGKSKSIKITLPKLLTKVTKYTGKDGEVIITYKNNNNKIASVSKTGKVTGKKKGTAIITTTIQLSDGSKKIFNTKVVVK